jgi:hypothetical protein
MNSKLKLLAVVVWFNWKSARNYHTPQYTVTSVKLEFTWAICSVRKNPGEFCPILVYVFSFDAFVTLSSLLWLLCQMKLFHFGHQSYITGTYFQFGLDIFDILWCESMYVSCGKKKKKCLSFLKDAALESSLLLKASNEIFNGFFLFLTYGP